MPPAQRPPTGPLPFAAEVLVRRAQPLSTDLPARAAAAEASGVAATKRLLPLRALPAPLATALRPRFYVVLRDAHGREHRPPFVRKTWAKCSVLVRDSEGHSIRTLCSRGFPARLKFVLGAKVRALPCQVRSLIERE